MLTVAVAATWSRLTPTLLAGPVENRRVVVSPAETLHVELAGTGPVVVLIPGLFGSAYGFRHVVRGLVDAGYRTVVIEPLAIGESSRPEGVDYSAGAQAGRIAAALDSLAIRQALVVAHSAAASEALRLAYARPDLVAAVLSIESGPAETIATPGFRRAMRFAPLVRLFGVSLLRRKIRHELVSASGDDSWITADVVRAYTAPAQRNLGATLKAFRAMANSQEADSLGPHLPHIQIPVALLLGTAPHDAAVSQAEIRVMQENLRSFAVDTVPGAGHYIQEERPEAVVAAISRLQSRATRASTASELNRAIRGGSIPDASR